MPGQEKFTRPVPDRYQPRSPIAFFWSRRSLQAPAWSLLLIYVLAFCATTLLAQDPAAKLRVGFVGPLSGSAQVYGVSARHGIELALADLGEDAGIELFYEDDRFEASKTVSAFHHLTHVVGVDLVISIASGPSNAIAPLAQVAGVPLLAWASDTNVSAGRSMVVRTYPSGMQEGRMAAQEAVTRSYQRAAVVISQNDYPISWRSGVRQGFSSNNIVVDEAFSPGTNDFRPFLTHARQKGVESFFLCLNPGSSGIFARQARELFSHLSIGGCENLHDWDEVVGSQGGLVGAWFPTIAIDPKFRERYQQAYHNQNVLSGAAIHHDLIMLLADLSMYKGISGEEVIARLLRSGTRHGTVGAYEVRENDSDRFFDIPLRIAVIGESGFQ